MNYMKLKKRLDEARDDINKKHIDKLKEIQEKNDHKKN